MAAAKQIVKGAANLPVKAHVKMDVQDAKARVKGLAKGIVEVTARFHAKLCL